MQALDNYSRVVEDLLKKHQSYRRGAYFFIRELIIYSIDKFKKNRGQHLSEKEIIEGLKTFAIEMYGPLAREVLAHWGLKKGEDIAKILTYLEEAKVIKRHSDDNFEQFSSLDFKKEFDNPFMPNK